MAPSATLRKKREALVREHMDSENRHEFDVTLRTFDHPRYELIGTGEVHDGAEEVERYYEEVIGQEIPDKMPMPLRVHRHEGEPCPRCGTTIEAVFFSEHQTNYCPEEQTGGRVLKDRRLSRLLK